MMTPKIVAYGKGMKPTGGKEMSTVEKAKALTMGVGDEQPPLEGQRYEEDGAQAPGTELGDGGSGQHHKSISMKRGGGPRNPGGRKMRGGY